jgi:hypothetical protein
MYWWNVSKLAEDLREGRVDEKERFKYFVASLVAWTLAGLFIVYSPGPFDTTLPLSAAAYLIMAIFGTVFCYRANKSGDNADFMPRMICLGLPAAIQFAAFFATLFLIIGAIESLPAAASGSGVLSLAYIIPGNTWKLWTERFADTGTIVFTVLYFQTIYDHIALAAKVKGAEKCKRLKQTMNWPTERVIFGLLSGFVLLVMIVLTGVWVPRCGENNFAWMSLTLLAIIVWTLLFVFVCSRLRPRSMKQTSSANEANELP